MKKTLFFTSSVIALAVSGLVIDGKVDNKSVVISSAVAQNLNCPSLDESLVPVEHRLRASLNQSFKIMGSNCSDG